MSLEIRIQDRRDGQRRYHPEDTIVGTVHLKGLVRKRPSGDFLHFKGECLTVNGPAVAKSWKDLDLFDFKKELIPTEAQFSLSKDQEASWDFKFQIPKVTPGDRRFRKPRYSYFETETHELLPTYATTESCAHIIYFLFAKSPNLASSRAGSKANAMVYWCVEREYIMILIPEFGK
jgi:hypothetical protein